ncbi:MAG: cupin domain-containing protein [Spirochaetes bacterium]|nr:cupin domain-containing protein [Spirochaetota bacterium]
MKKDANYWIKSLNLVPHPEGGHFREIYRSRESIVRSALPSRFKGDRCLGTSIYFLLQKGEISALHRLKSDEIWYYHYGAPLTVYIIHNDCLITRLLGLRVQEGEQPQVIVPAGAWFGATIEGEGDFTLVGCAVIPGFDYEDFEIADPHQLVAQYPAYRAIIEKLTKKVHVT